MNRLSPATASAAALAASLLAFPAATQPAAASASILAAIPAGQTKTVDLALRARIGPLTLARGSFRVSLSRDSYSADATYETAGIAASFSNDAGSTSVRGTVSDASLRPRGFVNQETNGKKRRVTMAFRGNDVDVTAAPMWGDMGFPAATAAQKAESVDPLTALLELSLVTGRDDGKPCGGVVKVFDGKRRYDIRTQYVREERVSTPAYRGMSSYCRGTYTEVAGFKRKKPSDSREPIRLELWVANVGNSGVSIPVRMTGGRGGINATLYAERATVR